MTPATLVCPVLRTVYLSLAVLVHLVSQATEKIAEVAFSKTLHVSLVMFNYRGMLIYFILYSVVRHR